MNEPSDPISPSLNVLVVINAHVKELASRLEALSGLAQSCGGRVVVLTTASRYARGSSWPVSSESVEVISVPDWRAPVGLSEGPVSRFDVAPADSPECRQAAWKLFVADRHISDLADIGPYATRRYTPDDLLTAFNRASSAVSYAMQHKGIDVVFPGAPDNYLSALVFAYARQASVPCLFWGGMDLCGPGRLVVYDSLDLGNNVMTECLDRTGRRTRSSRAEGTPSFDSPRFFSASSDSAEHIAKDPFALQGRSRFNANAHAALAVRTVRSAAGSWLDHRKVVSGAEPLLTTTERTPTEAFRHYRKWLGRRSANRRSLERSAKRIAPKSDGVANVLVPLHYQPEAYVTFAVPELANQLMWVRLLSLALPSTAQIWVKEHPGQDPGWRPRDFYDDLLSLPRVSLCAPDSSSLDLLRAGALDLVCTLGGSMAVEAPLYGVRVVTAIKSITSTFPGVVQLDPFSSNFPSELRHILSLGPVRLTETDVHSWYRCLTRSTIPDGTSKERYVSLLRWAVSHGALGQGSETDF